MIPTSTCTDSCIGNGQTTIFDRRPARIGSATSKGKVLCPVIMMRALTCLCTDPQSASHLLGQTWYTLCFCSPGSDWSPSPRSIHDLGVMVAGKMRTPSPPKTELLILTAMRIGSGAQCSPCDHPQQGLPETVSTVRTTTCLYHPSVPYTRPPYRYCDTAMSTIPPHIQQPDGMLDHLAPAPEPPPPDPGRNIKIMKTATHRATSQCTAAPACAAVANIHVHITAAHTMDHLTSTSRLHPGPCRYITNTSEKKVCLSGSITWEGRPWRQTS